MSGPAALSGSKDDMASCILDSLYIICERCLSGEVLVLVCAGGSPSLKWLFSIISRVSSGVSVRVPSGLYTESSFAFLSLQFFRILLILADSLADSVSAQNLRHSLRLVLVWSLLYVLLLMRRLSQRVGLLLPLAAMSLRFMSRCAFSTSGVSHGGFLIVLDMYVRGHALLNALRRCSLSLVAAVSRSLVVVMLFVFMSLVGLMVRYSSKISQSVFFVKRTCRGLLCCLESMLNVM